MLLLFRVGLQLVPPKSCIVDNFRDFFSGKSEVTDYSARYHKKFMLKKIYEIKEKESRTETLIFLVHEESRLY